MIDIANKEVLKDYLLNKKIVSLEKEFNIKYFEGGVSGTVAFVECDNSMYIIKQALSKLKVKADWFSDPSRMVIEKDSNEVYYKLVPDYAPKVYFYDEENYIYGREAVPESSVMWKTDLLNGILDFEVAKQAIKAIAIVHEECSYNEKIKEQFKDKSFFYDLRISPYIERIVEVHPKLQIIAKPIITRLMASETTLIHGDYSPKNILVDNRKICVLDFEVAHCGHPSFDLAFFSNHFFLKAIKNKDYSKAYLNMLEFMMNIYFDHITFADKNELERDTIELLALLFIARVDGKSPAEYITEESDKSLIRDIAFTLIETKTNNFKKAIEIVLSKL